MSVFIVEPSLSFVSKVINQNLSRSVVVGSRAFWSKSKELKKVEKNTVSQKTSSEELDIKKYDPHYLHTSNNSYGLQKPVPWFEKKAVKEVVKKNNLVSRIKSMDDLLRELHAFNEFPKNWMEVPFWLHKKRIRKELLLQEHIPQRHMVLKPDLAAAHFIIFRGGLVKFKNNDSWIGLKEAQRYLPLNFIPGYEIEGINAEGTRLRREGLANISDLPHLKWLSLKGLEEIDDWCLEIIANEFKGLEYLDITNCKNITFMGLTCFHRLESLKSLIVTNVSDSPEFKVACLMLQDVLPELKIGGIDLRIPLKIDSQEQMPESLGNDNRMIKQKQND